MISLLFSYATLKIIFTISNMQNKKIQKFIFRTIALIKLLSKSYVFLSSYLYHVCSHKNTFCGSKFFFAHRHKKFGNHWPKVFITKNTVFLKKKLLSLQHSQYFTKTIFVSYYSSIGSFVFKISEGLLYQPAETKIFYHGLTYNLTYIA